jgi:hypothetical protein
LPVDKDEGLQPASVEPVGDTLRPADVDGRSRSVSRSRGVSMHDPEAQEAARRASRMSMSVGGAHG